MPYILHQHPGVRIDLAVKKEYLPRLAGTFRRCECVYEREEPYEVKEKGEWVKLIDVHGDKGWKTGALMSLFFALEWSGTGGKAGRGLEDKFYILVSPRRKEKKKHVRQDREEAGTGSEGGDPGESAGDIRYGQDL